MVPRPMQRAFSLAELLIVTSIAVFAAMMILPLCQPGSCTPSYTSCMNNNRQLAVAALLYREDFQVFPNVDDLPGNDGPIALATLANYVRGTNVLGVPLS